MRTFLFGSEEEAKVQRRDFEVDIDIRPSEIIWCDEHEREIKAREYVECASELYHPGKMIAADYGPTPDGLGITVCMWYRTPKEQPEDYQD